MVASSDLVGGALKLGWSFRDVWIRCKGADFLHPLTQQMQTELRANKFLLEAAPLGKG